LEVVAVCDEACDSMEAETQMSSEEALEEKQPKPVDLAALRAFMLRLYGGRMPTGVVDDLIRERRREATRSDEHGRA
jgi:hypothetical protein